MTRTIEFSKIHGNGNDFVFIDDLESGLNLSNDEVRFLCDRHFGIGADGILVMKPGGPGFDFTMEYYNRDGKRVDFCGNGGRCITFMAGKILEKDQMVFMADDGRHIGHILDDGRVSISMIEPKPMDIQIHNPEELFKRIPVRHHYMVNTGVPHLVLELKDVKEEEFWTIPVADWGKRIRYSREFPEGININFTCRFKGEKVLQRTYERGVEDETLSCGTGSVAVAMYWNQKTESAEFTVKTRGGLNSVRLKDGEKPVLTGNVMPVFQGTILL